MRKLLLTILVIVTAIFSSVNAAVVTEAEARAKANSFIAKRTTYKLMTKSRATQMQYAWDSKTLLGDNVTNSTQSVLSASVSNEPTFYVYSNESSFVIVSGESTTREILGFSNEGGISSVENLPAPMKEYLSGIDAEIKSVRANNNAILTPTAIEDELGEYKLLETAIWDQGAPFNKNASNGLTGCVPTAFAIIMRYHQWPLQGKVATLPSGSETIDLSSHTYDWSKMPLSYLNGYTEEQGNAVAQLMSDLGLSMGATYNSGTTDVNVTSNIGRKFQQNFDYTGEYDLSQKDVQYADNEAGWIAKIIESIDNNCPIPYSGTRTSGSGTAHYLHMFVLDGYSENNYFHFNWGWSGDGNGWFTLSTMGPSADRLYTQSNKAYFNLAPNKATYAISASASPATAGVVSINGGTSSSSVTISTYENSVVTLTAEANDGYTFKNWTRGTSEMSTDKTYKATVTSDELNNEYVANFLTVGTTNISIPVSYNSSYGTVTYNGNAVDGTGIVAKENQEVTLVANPLAGYLFLGWTIERGTSTDTVTSESLTFIAEDGMRITAEFSLATVEYSIDTTNGALHNYDGTKYYELWKSNDERLTLTSPGEYTITSSMQLWCLGKTINYQLSVSDDFVITGYTLRYKKGSSSFNITLSAPGREDQTPGSTTAEQEFIVDNEDSSTTSFSLTGTAANQFITITSFTVNVKKKGASDPEVTKYTVTVTAGTGGSATASASQVAAGESVTFTATPDDGYEFVNWTSGTSVVSTENPYTTTVTGDMDLVANFQALPTYNVSVIAGTGGSATASSYAVKAGGTVTLTATPDDGYEFVNWTSGTSVVSTENPYTATITADTEFVANFNVVSSGGGGETPSYCEPSGDTYSNNYLTSITTTGANTNLEYTASSHPGNAHVVVPTVIEVSPGNSFTLNLVANSLGAGSSSVIREDIRYCHASLFTDFDRDGDFGSAVGKWGNNGGANNAPSHNVYGNYDEVMNIAATINVPANAPEGTSHIRVIYTNAWNAFPTACTTSLDKGIAYDFIINVVAENKYSVSVIAGTGGSATASASQVAAGESVTFTATPDDGYEFVNWTSGTSVVSTENPYTTTVTGDMELVANFQALPTYNVSVIAGAGGSATASSDAVKAGETVTFTATPDDGYEFVNWTSGTSVVSTENPYTTTVTGDMELVANFQALPAYNVSVIAGAGGSATASASQVAAGESVTFTATPDDGYEFVNWTSGTSVVSTENPYTTTVTGDMELVANFQALPTYNVGVIAGTGGSATASSYAVKAGGTVTLTATPNDGYEFVNWTIGTSVVSTENPYVATITSNVEFVANFQESSQGGGSDVVEYCEPLGSVSRNDRGITTLDVSDDLGNSVSVSGLGTVANRALYVDRTTTILNTEPGATIYIRNNGAGAWMHSYVYVDFGNDGVFDVSEANCYNGNVDGDLVSHTGYTGVYSTTDPSVASDGRTVGYDENNSGIYDYNYNEAFNCDIPAFTLPLDIKPGLYRVRHKMDWNCIDPCGRTSDKYTDNIITNNAGGIIDFMINVRSTQPTITYSANTGGAIEAKDGLEATANTIESGSVIESDIYIILIPHQYNGKENTISSATISTMSGSQSLTIQNGENDGDVKEVAAVGTQPHYWYYHIPYTSVTESIEFTAMFEGVVQGLHGLYGDDFSIAVFDRTVSILNYTGDARIVNVEGQVLRSVSVEGTAQIELNKGVYFVVTANKVVKVMIK